MINISYIHRELIKNSPIPFSHNDVKKLLEGKKGKFDKKGIQLVRRIVSNQASRVDSVLAKLENQQ